MAIDFTPIGAKPRPPVESENTLEEFTKESLGVKELSPAGKEKVRINFTRLRQEQPPLSPQERRFTPEQVQRFQTEQPETTRVVPFEAEPTKFEDTEIRPTPAAGIIPLAKEEQERIAPTAKPFVAHEGETFEQFAARLRQRSFQTAEEEEQFTDFVAKPILSLLGGGAGGGAARTLATRLFPNLGSKSLAALTGAGAVTGEKVATEAELPSPGEVAVGAALGPPLEAAAGFVGRLFQRVAPKAEELLAKAARKRGEAEKITTEILQPTKRALADAKRSGVQLKSVEQLAQNLEKAESFDEILSSVRTIQKENITARNKLIEKAKNKITSRFLNPLKESIDELKESGQFTEQANLMEKIFQRELDFVKKKGGSLTIQEAETRKEFLSNQIKNFFKKAQVAETETPVANAIDKLRSGLRSEIENRAGKKVGAEISRLNQVFGGLEEASDFLASQSAAVEKAITPVNPTLDQVRRVAEKVPFLDKLVRKIPEGQTQIQAAAQRVEEVLPKKTQQVKTLISEVEELTRRAESPSAIQSSFQRLRTSLDDLVASLGPAQRGAVTGAAVAEVE